MPSSERDERVALTVKNGIALDDERASSLDSLLSLSDGLEGMARLGGDEYAGANCSAVEFLRRLQAEFPISAPRRRVPQLFVALIS